MKTQFKFEVQKPNDKIMEGAIASIGLSEKYNRKENGRYVVFSFENCTQLEAFKLGRSFQNLLSK